MTPTAHALVGFISLALFLLVLMEAIRCALVLQGKIAANRFAPDNSGLSPFMQRLARAHANCVEGLPIFGGLLVFAIVTSKTAATDPTAYLFLAARIFQSTIHLLSTSVMAVNIRFAAFAVQMALGVYWALQLIG